MVYIDKRSDGSERIERESCIGKEVSLEEERKYLYLLNNLCGITNKKINRMYKLAGSFEAAYKADKAFYLERGIFKEGKDHGFGKRGELEERLLERYEGLRDLGIRLYAIFDEDYPERLRETEDAPLLLYVKGRLPSDEEPTAAIIGGRICSGYGIHAAGHFSAELSEAGVQIVSGMAHGIDAAAHLAALKAGYSSFAVLGGGVNYCYPKENIEIYEMMSGGQGGVISEYPPSAPPEAWRFITRNRIIAGLSDVVIVAEAKVKSGTAITVDYALRFGRDVFSVPHRFDDELGEGCNKLISDGAGILIDKEDVMSVLGEGKKRFYREKSIRDMASDGQSPAYPKRRDTETSKSSSDMPPKYREIKATETESGKGPKPLSYREQKLKEKISQLASSEKIVYSFLDLNEKHTEELCVLSGLSLSETLKALYSLKAKGLCSSPHASYYRKVPF